MRSWIISQIWLLIEGDIEFKDALDFLNINFEPLAVFTEDFIFFKIEEFIIGVLSIRSKVENIFRRSDVLWNLKMD